MADLAQFAAFETRLAEIADVVGRALDELIPRSAGPEAKLFEAMRYAALGGGKRLRPFLLIETGRLLGSREPSLEQGLVRLACAIECVHAYSLVHDDLPCMDDDDLRRGRPTVHKAFDEATAVLAGDALLTLAFEIAAAPETHADPAVQAQLVRRLAKASGGEGMVGGQVIDIETEGRNVDLETIGRLQRLKTGALIGFSVEGGALLAGASREALGALQGYAQDLGLAYQIVDDLLDCEGTQEDLGKAVRKDAARGKASFVAVLGLEGARVEARRLATQAKARLDLFGPRADILKTVVDYVLERRG